MNISTNQGENTTRTDVTHAASTDVSDYMKTIQDKIDRMRKEASDADGSITDALRNF